MKRSDMIKKLAKALEYDEPCIGAEAAGLESAEIALKIIEEEGMLPPMVRGNYDFLTHPEHYWEPEDETK